MTQFAHSRSELRINILCYIELTVFDGKCLCLCSTGLNARNTVLEQRLRGIFGLQTEGVARDEQNCIVGSCMVCIGE